MLKELFPDLSMFDLMSHCTSWSPNWTDLYFWYLFAYVNRQLQKTYQSNLIPLQCTVPTVSASNCKIVQISSHDQRTESLQLAPQPIYTFKYVNIFDVMCTKFSLETQWIICSSTVPRCILWHGFDMSIFSTHNSFTCNVLRICELMAISKVALDRPVIQILELLSADQSMLGARCWHRLWITHTI